MDWETASELNNDFFAIKRLKDAELWEDIAIIKGEGATAQATRHQAFDIQPLSGVSFYRLRQTDFDGQETPVFSVSIKFFNALGQELSPPLAFEKDAITVDISAYPPVCTC